MSYDAPPPPPPPPPGGAYGGGPAYGAVPASNKKALWSMISGIVSLFCCGIILGVVAIVLSRQASAEIDASGGSQTGAGQAKAGLILGIIGVIGWLILLIVRFAVAGNN